LEFLKNNSIKMLLIALGFGALAALLGVLYLKARESALLARMPSHKQIEVVVANRDLNKGTVLELDPEKFAVRPIPVDYVHTDAITYAEFNQLQGKKLVQNLGQGKPLLRSFIEDTFPRDFSDTIPLKRRAMTVQVDEVNSVNGFIRPGNLIDILVNLPGGSLGEKSKDSVMPVLESVEVLATGRDSSKEYEEKMMLIQGGVMAAPLMNFTSITVNVTPREAALLETAQEKGDLLALLRNRADTSGSGFTEVLPMDLLGNADKLARDAQLREATASLEKQGLVVGEDGLIRTRDGVVLKDQNLVIAEDGTIMTKDGVVLSGRGLTINEKGELVTADGTVVNSEDLMLAADGSIITKDGKVLGGGKNAQQLAGKALGKDDLVVNPDGTVMTKDGRVLAGVRMDAGGNLVDENGNPVVVTASGAVLKGVRTDENGNVILADGTVVSPEDLIVSENGEVRTRDGKLLAGVEADTRSLATGTQVAGIEQAVGRYDFYVGGVSQDGVATANSVPYSN
jgi:pilus assembly protein CpaB